MIKKYIVALISIVFIAGCLGCCGKNDNSTNIESNNIESSSIEESVVSESYIVNFDTDGGSKIKSIKVESGKLVNKPINPIKQEENGVFYEFNNWLLNGEVYDFNQEINSSITLKASYTISYLVTFNTDGGNELEAIKVKKGTKLKRPTDPIKEDKNGCAYEFNFWSLNGKEFDFNSEINFPIVLEANYSVWGPIIV